MLNAATATVPMVKCFAMCRESVADPANALGWGVATLLGGTGSAWFCPACYGIRTGRELLSAVTDRSPE